MNGIWPINVHRIMHWFFDDDWIGPLSKQNRKGKVEEIVLLKGNFSKLLFDMYWIWTINRYCIWTIDWNVLDYWDFLHNWVWLGNMNCKIDEKFVQIFVFVYRLELEPELNYLEHELGTEPSSQLDREL